MPPGKVAVLGGGLTGLSSAYHLSRRFPKSQIILLEKSSLPGGWVCSERVYLPSVGASVLLEGGPRTLRPNNKSVLELIHLLKLEDQLVTVSKSAPPAKSRYLYIPPSQTSEPSGLQRLPSSLISLLLSPLLPMMLNATLREPFKKANRPAKAQDESVDSFFTRRFGESFARTFGSALVHGIYAADSRKLSVRAAFPSIWDAETRGAGSMIRGLMIAQPSPKTKEEPYDLGKMSTLMRNVAVFSFRDGMQTLTEALRKELTLAPNVTILGDAEISSLKPSEDETLEITHSCGTQLEVTHAVSALPIHTLQQILKAGQESNIPYLPKNPVSTVRVVNFIFPGPPKQLHPEGFGYLIPRPATDYPRTASNSSRGILGTVFDSCSLHEQDSPKTRKYYTDSLFTKLTMMTGGPYAREALPSQLISSPEDPTIPPFIRSLLDALQVQLGKPIPDPLYWRIWNNESCIPTLMPGHNTRVAKMERGLKDKTLGWGGRLEIIGAGVGGVSVGDCIQAGRHAGRDWT